jgi:hypothetical protein
VKFFFGHDEKRKNECEGSKWAILRVTEKLSKYDKKLLY